MATQDGRADIGTLRRELLRRRLAERDLAESPVALRRERSLSAGQRRMWSLQQLDPATVGYNVRIAVDLTGPLDPAGIARAARTVVARHEALRTTYRLAEDGEVAHVVHADLPPEVDLHDLGGLPADAREAEVDRLCRELGSRPFDLAADSPLRVGVLTTGPAATTLVVVAHHIAWDDATSAIFFGELMAVYARPDAVLPPARQLADLAPQPAGEAGLAFWRDTLGTPPEPLELPLPRTADAGVDQQRAFTPGAAGRVRDLAKLDGASTFMVLLAAVAALLHRYTGSRDLVIGAPVVNRDLPGGDEVIGYLGNTIPLRVRVDPTDTFAELLSRTKRACLDAYAHQDVDLDDVARAVDPGRRRGDAGLFDVVLSLRTPVLEPLRGNGFTATRRHVPGPDARFALTLAVETDGDDLTVEANHPAVPHGVELVARLLGHLDLLLDAAVAAPGTPVADLPVLTADEHARLAGWNDTAAEVAPPLLPELFARQVAATPDARAVLAAGRELTYRELDGRASALARLLVRRGVGPESVVALAVPRSADLVVAVLAVVKAGAAYVPVDPGYPADRVRFMLADARPGLLLTTRDTRLPVPPGLPTVLVDEPGLPAGHPAGDPEVALRPGHPAYVIYTSGSTGVPKGVVVSHGALRNHLAWSVRRFHGLSGHTLVHSSISFDFTVTPLFGPLITGGCLELCADSPDAIADAVGAATFLKITPSHLPLLPSVRFADTGPRTLVIAGEELRGEALDGWRAPEGLDVINEYGPTETTVGCLLHPVESADGVVAPGPVPVGSPVDNVTCHVLDDRLRPVPVGVDGELYVGGAQDARGYLDRPGLTATRFVADPFGDGRLYRTGDRVRRLPSGALEFRGRTDDQVKIRGHRVEPGEVEAVLRAHPDVDRAAVVARSDGPGGTYLAAYVVGRPVDAAALRAHVAASLPEHLVPAAFVPLARLPLSPSGKLDRRALPAPDFAAAPTARTASGGLEAVFAGLFAEALKRDSVGVEESFFELGGDSIVAIRLVARARKAGVKITPRDVFAHPTPAKLAALPGVRPAPDGVESRLAGLFAEVLGRDSVGVEESFFELGGDSIVAIRLVARARKAGLKITPREVFAHPTAAELARVAAVQEVAAPAGDGVGPVESTPIMRSFAARGPFGDGHRMSVLLDGPEALAEDRLLVALQAVLDRHDALRARLTGAGLEFRPVGSVRAADVLRRAGAGADELEAAAARLAPREGVVLQAVWFPGTPRLLVVAHHLVVDGVSWRVFVEDLAAAYRDEPVPPVPTSFRAWAQGLRDRAADRVGELATWRDVLDGPDPLPALGEQTWSDVRTVTVRLDPETTEAVLTTVPALFFAGVDDVLLTALGIAVGSWRGDARSFSVLLEGHGRQEAAVPGVDLSRTIGWFTSQHPVRLDTTGVDLADALAGGPAAGTLVKRVKEHLRSLPDHGIGYGVLRHLRGEPEVAGAPEPRVGFNYLGRFDAAGEAGWTVPAGGLSAAYDPDMPLFAGLVVNAVTETAAGGPELVAHWMLADGVFDPAEVADLAELWCAAVRGLARHAAGGGAGGRTPSDVPLISLDQSQLDALEAKWKRA